MNITERNLDDVVQALRFGREHGRKCSLLIGAGCSVSAGIPSARGFVELIEKEFPEAYKRVEPKTYPHCMAELESGVQHALIAREVDNARINWGHVAIAQLMEAGYVDRVLTTNFDPLVVRACALCGIHPAVYDFAASQLLKRAQVPDLAVFHLHGQRTGFVLMNTSKECTAQAERLGPLFQDAGDGRIWVVVGYSGEADPVFDHLATISAFDHGLYWVGYADSDPALHVRKRLLTDKQGAYFVRGFDSDSFFVQLTQKLECFPPTYIERPFTHLSKMMDVLTPYKMPQGDDAELDVTAKARDMIGRAIDRFESRPGAIESGEDHSMDAIESVATKLLMAGKYREVQALNAAMRGPSPRVSEMTAWSFFNEGTQLALQAQANDGALADRLFDEAYQKYRAALAIVPVQHAVLNNWGNALMAQAKTKQSAVADRLYSEATEKFEAALKIKPDKRDALSNWGIALSEQAKTKHGAEADRLYVEGQEKFQSALAINRNDHRTLYNWGVALQDRAKIKQGAEADGLLEEAGQKYQAALAIKRDMYEALYNWGNVLADRAKIKSGDEADRLFAAAYEKYKTAVEMKPDMCEALNGWGCALRRQAKTKRGDEADRLFAASYEKYRAAIAVKPDMHEVFYNWGNTLSDQAMTKRGTEADDLFANADEKFQAALAIKPNKHGALNNWGLALADRAKIKSGDEADRLFAEAYGKYRAALEAKPDKYETFYNWGNALLEQAITKRGTEADGLFAEAYRKYADALMIKPDMYEALNVWGYALTAQAWVKRGIEAENLWAEADKKYEAALLIKPDAYDVFNNWGIGLLRKAEFFEGEKRRQLVNSATERLAKAQQYGCTAAIYNIALAAVLLGDLEAAKQHLIAAKKSNALPDKAHIKKDPGLSALRDDPWFQGFLRTL